MFPYKIPCLGTDHDVRQALREAPNLTRLVVTPLGALPALAVLDLTACPKLGYLFLQCASLRTLLLGGCMALTKVWQRLRALSCCALISGWRCAVSFLCRSRSASSSSMNVQSLASPGAAAAASGMITHGCASAHS